MRTWYDIERTKSLPIKNGSSKTKQQNITIIQDEVVRVMDHDLSGQTSRRSMIMGKDDKKIYGMFGKYLIVQME